ncbi:helix-turn-helix domain-containing protein [Agrobacterium deltaense]|uniref:helix-turn-helix domain-containing protein n=1 Tax=Agrobacterium deltaense TaxID=1183412 RepID=UPI003D96A466
MHSVFEHCSNGAPITFPTDKIEGLPDTGGRARIPVSEFRLEQTALRAGTKVCLKKSSQGRGWTGIFAAVTEEHPHETLYGAVPAVWLTANLTVAGSRRWLPGSGLHQVLSNDLMSITAAGEAVRSEVEEPMEAMHIFLRQEIIDAVADDLYAGGDVKRSISSSAGIDDGALRCFISSIRASLDTMHASTLEMDYLAYALAAYLLHHHSAPGRTTVNPRVSEALNARQMGIVVDYVEANLETGISVAQLADIAGVGRARFLPRFKAATLMTPHQYVLEQKIRRSQRLLTRSQMDHVNIAALCGFVDQAHFASTFKRIVKMTPRDYRASHCIFVGAHQ